MNNNSLLEINESLIKDCILKEFGMTDRDINESVETIKKWLKTQRHLPEIPNDKMLRNFLNNNKFSIEKVKQKIDMYYTIRSLIPDFYENRNPNSPHMIEQSNVTEVAALPKYSPNCKRILHIRTSDKYEPNRLMFEESLGIHFSILEILMNEDFSMGFEVIFDCKHVKLGHVPRLGLMAFKKAALVLDKVYSNRVQAFHIINAAPFLDTVITMGKSVLKTKISSRVKVHKTLDSLYEYLPRDILPEDIGGDEPSLSTLAEMWRKKIVEYKYRFDKLEKLKVNEALRPEPLVNNDILGWHGNFRKLDVD